METEQRVETGEDSPARNRLNKRLEEVAWGVFLIMLGGLWLAPNEPAGAWLIGAGSILLVLNLVRYAKSLRVHWLTVVLGAVALAAGIGDALGIEIPVFAILLVALGVLILARPLLRHHTV